MRNSVFLWVAVLFLGAGCGGDGGTADCIPIGGSVVAGSISVQPPQVILEVKFIMADDNAMQDLGVDWSFSTSIQTGNGGPLGGVSRQGRDVVAPSALVGGVPNADILVTNGFRGFQSIVNIDFISPYDGEDGRVVSTLPFDGECLVFDDQVVSDIQNFAGGSNQPVLPAADPGLAGDALYNLYDDVGIAALLQSIEADTRNRVLTMPQVTVTDNQRALIVVPDILAQASDLRSDFRDRVQSVVQNPFGIFTGPTLDVRPQVSGNDITLTVHIATEAATFYRSVPADVGSSSADIEIPLVKPSTAITSVTVADGQTVVIGGILPAGQSQPENGLPVLDKVPVVGDPARQYSDPTRQDLIFVVTPRIVATPP